MRVSLSQARAVIDGAERKTRELGVPVAITVIDPGCHLKTFCRMDEAALGLTDLAMGKAKTAALFACNSEDIQARCGPDGPFPGLERSHDGLTIFTGGMLLAAPDGAILGNNLSERGLSLPAWPR